MLLYISFLFLRIYCSIDDVISAEKTIVCLSGNIFMTVTVLEESELYKAKLATKLM